MTQKRYILIVAIGIGVVMFLHLFGGIGRTIEEETEFIDYARIVTMQEYLDGLHAVTLPQIVDRFHPRLFVQMLVLGALCFLALRTDIIARTKHSYLLAGSIIALLLQWPPFTLPGCGIVALATSGLIQGRIDGEIYGEDWFTWAAFDISFFLTVLAVVVIMRTKTTPPNNRMEATGAPLRESPSPHP